MLHKRLILVPLLMLLAVGSLQAATVSSDWINYQSDWANIFGYKKVLVRDDGSKLEWRGSINKWSNATSLTFSGNDLNLSSSVGTAMIELGSLTFKNTVLLGTKPSPLTADLVLTIPGFGSAVYDFSIKTTAGNDSYSIVLDKDSQSEFKFRTDSKEYTLTLLGFATKPNGKYDFAATGREWKNQTFYLVGEMKTAAVPLPATAWLLGSGLIGLLGLRRRA